MNIQTQSRGKWTSASSAEPDLRCPARHLAQLSIPEPERGPDATFGDHIHKALANPELADKLTMEERDVFDACQQIEGKLLNQYFPGVATNEIEVIRETRYWLTVNKGEFRHSGQIDCAFRHGGRALIVEYKTLAGDVAGSPSNLQLRDQAVLLSLTEKMRNIGCAVVQPFATHSPTICEYEEADLERAKNELKARVIASNNPASPRVAGEVQCKFCRATEGCAEYHQWAQRTVPVPVSIIGVPVAQWTPEQRATFCAGRSIAQKWLDDCESAMKKLLEADAKAIPGWKLTPGRVKHPITNPQGVFERFATLGGKVEDFMNCVDVGKGDLKKALAAVTKKKGKALDAELEKLTEGLTGTKQDRPSLGKEEE